MDHHHQLVLDSYGSEANERLRRMYESDRWAGRCATCGMASHLQQGWDGQERTWYWGDDSSAPLRARGGWLGHK